MIYLDWAASSPPEAEALETARDISSRFFANPSSVHSAGKTARNLLEEARDGLTRILGGGRLLFTSGATESNASILLAQLARRTLAGSSGGAAGIVVSSIEHASVHEQALRLRDFGLRSSFASAESDGIVDPGRIVELIDDETVLVSVMFVNNETGVVQRVGDIVRAVRDRSKAGGRRILVHSDASQGFGKLSFRPLDLGLDAVSLSGHKMGGPRGIGALWLAPEVSPAFLSAGGGQESGMRPGTENLPGACAFEIACEKRIHRQTEELAAAREKSHLLMRALREIPGIRFFPESRGDPGGASGGEQPYSPYILCFGFPPLPGEVLVRQADSRGFLIGSGSACSSRKKNRTRVLESMGISAGTAISAVRVSFGPATPSHELESFADFLKKEIPALYSVSSGSRA
jgi:cysteine desulfurase